MATDAEYHYDSLIIGNDLNAVQLALKNKSCLLLNSYPRIHSYDRASPGEDFLEEQWAEATYKLYNLGLCPFSGIKSIRIDEEKKSVKVYTDTPGLHHVKYEDICILDYENVYGVEFNRNLVNYRVVDWFDCQGLYKLEFEEIKTEDQFVNLIKFFKSTRIDGNQKYLDLLCESYLSEEQLKNFDYSDTMVRLKVEDLLRKRGLNKVKMRLWKRDVYPVYK
jgi:hypothetical protein